MGHRQSSRVRGVFERDPGSGIWWIRYEVNGKPKREKVGRRSDAIALYQKRKTEVRVGIKLPENLRTRGATFAEIGRDAIEWYLSHNRKDIRSFTGRMNSMIAALGNRLAEDLTPKEIDAWLGSHPRWTPGTRNRYKTVMSKAFQLALVDGKVSRNPARLVQYRHEEIRRIRYLLPEEETRLRAALLKRCPGHLPAFEVALHTGMRRGEQFTLTWDGVDFDRKRIYLTKTKNGSDREIPMSRTCFAILQELHRQRPDDGRIFQSARYKQPVTDIKKAFSGALAEARVTNFRWHDLRHTFVSRLIMAGVDLRTVQELAGHRSISMTVRYAHLAPEHNQAAIEKLDSPGHD